MANTDLSTLAGFVKPSEPWKRATTRVREDNPFEDLLRQSWNTRWTDADGQEHAHGAPLELTVGNEDARNDVVRAIRRASKYTGLGAAITPNAEHENEDGSYTVKFRAKIPRGYRVSDLESDEFEGNEDESEDE